MRRQLERWLQQTWYDGGWGTWLLLPLSAVYRAVIVLRCVLYRAGLLPQTDVGVPVIVVGNLTVGGTGKTPVTIWLATALRERGFRPGIVSRGYGGSGSASPMRVDAASDPAVVGDEPVLLARRSGCPVAVDRNRVRAAEMLADDGADLIIADDGLQHLALVRSYEICVVDGRRWLGNGFVLPAGPLREPPARLHDVDQVLVNGRRRDAAMSAAEQNAIEFTLAAIDAVRLDGSQSRALERFAGTTVHAVAAIGNPARFFDLLRAHEIQVIEHPHPDHAVLEPGALSFDDDFEILVTEKDAVKLGDASKAHVWFVPVAMDIDPVASGPWVEQIESRLKSEADQGEGGKQ